MLLMTVLRFPFSMIMEVSNERGYLIRAQLFRHRWKVKLLSIGSKILKTEEAMFRIFSKAQRA